jgi:hypothetical protein
LGRIQVGVVLLVDGLQSRDENVTEATEVVQHQRRTRACGSGDVSDPSARESSRTQNVDGRLENPAPTFLRCLGSQRHIRILPYPQSLVPVIPR